MFDRRTDGQTDRRTDGQTEFPSLYRVCITCSAVTSTTGATSGSLKLQCIAIATFSSFFCTYTCMWLCVKVLQWMQWQMELHSQVGYCKCENIMTAGRSHDADCISTQFFESLCRYNRPIIRLDQSIGRYNANEFIDGSSQKRDLWTFSSRGL